MIKSDIQTEPPKPTKEHTNPLPDEVLYSTVSDLSPCCSEEDSEPDTSMIHPLYKACIDHLT